MTSVGAAIGRVGTAACAPVIFVAISPTVGHDLEDRMLGLMQSHGLLISTVLKHAARHHATGEILSRNHQNSTDRSNWAELESRARRLARVLKHLGVAAGDRVGTLAWNGTRHLEVYYAAPGM